MTWEILIPASLIGLLLIGMYGVLEIEYLKCCWRDGVLSAWLLIILIGALYCSWT